eukprot:TRINITY_DN24858_c0_g1_i1.p1 TRINITY_DN24858_c0_g1~~TRINITY_DN24858_c0_g1_i1.p1  ORF type:complete len:526 (-),score=93.24 TRINITY_DN24858_c0_g1_i1:139-1635(-)
MAGVEKLREPGSGQAVERWLGSNPSTSGGNAGTQSKELRQPHVGGSEDALSGGAGSAPRGSGSASGAAGSNRQDGEWADFYDPPSSKTGKEGEILSSDDSRESSHSGRYGGEGGRWTGGGRNGMGIRRRVSDRWGPPRRFGGRGFSDGIDCVDMVDEDERISHMLAKILRYHVAGCGLQEDADGYVLVADLLQLPEFEGVTEDVIRRVSSSSVGMRGQRFDLRSEAILADDDEKDGGEGDNLETRASQLAIRALYRHSQVEYSRRHRPGFGYGYGRRGGCGHIVNGRDRDHDLEGGTSGRVGAFDDSHRQQPPLADRRPFMPYGSGGMRPNTGFSRTVEKLEDATLAAKDGGNKAGSASGAVGCNKKQLPAAKSQFGDGRTLRVRDDDDSRSSGEHVASQTACGGAVAGSNRADCSATNEEDDVRPHATDDPSEAADEMWEMFHEPQTQRAWFWNEPTGEFFYADDTESGWERFTTGEGLPWWWHEESGRHFLEEDAS